MNAASISSCGIVAPALASRVKASVRRSPAPASVQRAGNAAREQDRPDRHQDAGGQRDQDVGDLEGIERLDEHERSRPPGRPPRAG